MKTSKIFIALGILVMMLTVSCQKEAKDFQAVDHGYCINGDCECDEGFTGKFCTEEMNQSTPDELPSKIPTVEIVSQHTADEGALFAE